MVGKLIKVKSTQNVVIAIRYCLILILSFSPGMRTSFSASTIGKLSSFLTHSTEFVVFTLTSPSSKDKLT